MITPFHPNPSLRDAPIPVLRGGRVLSWFSIFGVLLGLGAVTSFATVTPYVASLGSAQTFAVLVAGTANGASNPVLSLQGNSEIQGNVGVGPGGTLDISGKSNTIDGDLYTATPLTLSKGDSVGAIQVQSPALVNQAISDAISFSQTIAGFTATQTLDTVSSSTTIKGNGGVNVIDFTGAGVNLDKKDVLTLSGNANDIFYINFLNSADFSISGAAQIALAGGVNPNNIYWNVVDGQEASLTGGTAYGTILDINNSSALQGQGTDFEMKNATLYGRVVGGGSSTVSIANSMIVDIAEVQQAPEVGPKAAMAILGFLTMLSPLARFWRKKILSWG